jgi:PPK2 family polyphosphate:nucleotide phosphotransferase
MAKAKAKGKKTKPETGPDGGRRERIRKQLLVEPGTAANLAGRDTGWTGGKDYSHLSAKKLDALAKSILAQGTDRLADAQELLWASDRYALLIVFQAIDAAGKDSTIEHVMSGVNPQGVHVVSFKQPSSEELDHTFLWRIAKAVPERGRIGIFNRSHYEEVVALRVHPEWLERQRLPGSDRGPEFWGQRYDDINAFERHLDRNGTKIVKLFLHVSKAEQKRRFLARLDNPDKQWKFSAADVAERALWDQYMEAYEDAITATSTDWAPWYVIPADHKHVMQAMVATLLADTIDSLDLRWPTVSDEDRKANEKARQLLEAEPDDAVDPSSGATLTAKEA